MGKNEKLQKWGYKRGVYKKGGLATDEYRGCGNKVPKKTQKKSQKYGSSVIIVQENRRIDRGLGSMKDLSGDLSNMKLRERKRGEMCSL